VIDTEVGIAICPVATGTGEAALASMNTGIGPP
jgi:hypothetical protein